MHVQFQIVKVRDLILIFLINFLIFAEDHSVPKMIAQNQIESYRGWVQEYYEKIREIGYLPAKDFKDFLDDENQLHSGEFDTMAAVGQLWSYVTQVKYFFSDDDIFNKIFQQIF